MIVLRSGQNTVNAVLMCNSFLVPDMDLKQIYVVLSSCSRTAAQQRLCPRDHRRSPRPSGSSCLEGRQRRLAAVKVPQVTLWPHYIKNALREFKRPPESKVKVHWDLTKHTLCHYSTISMIIEIRSRSKTSNGIKWWRDDILPKVEEVLRLLFTPQFRNSWRNSRRNSRRNSWRNSWRNSRRNSWRNSRRNSWRNSGRNSWRNSWRNRGRNSRRNSCDSWFLNHIYIFVTKKGKM